MLLGLFFYLSQLMGAIHSLPIVIWTPAATTDTISDSPRRGRQQLFLPLQFSITVSYKQPSATPSTTTGIGGRCTFPSIRLAPRCWDITVMFALCPWVRFQWTKCLIFL